MGERDTNVPATEMVFVAAVPAESKWDCWLAPPTP